MDRNARLYYESALALSLPVIYRPEIKALNICLGKKHYYFFRSNAPLNEGANVFAAKNKYLANKRLQAAGFPVPRAVCFNKNTWLEKPLDQLIETLHFPLVAKPLQDCGRGFYVLCNIKNKTNLSEYLEIFFKKFNWVELEEFQQNLKEYRVLVLKNSVIGVVERFGASVMGDGLHTIQELIELKNVRKIVQSQSLTLSPLVYDLEYEHCLAEQGLNLDSIPEKQRNVRLCYTVNSSRGGDLFSQGKKIHPDNKKIICNAAQALGLDLVGFDLLCEDINLSFKDTKWVIIESNFCPDITIHEVPPAGIKTSVAKRILRQLIWRHPFAYLYHLSLYSRWSIYLRSFIMISLFWGLCHVIA